MHFNVGLPPKETGKWFLVKNVAWHCPAVMRYYPANYYGDDHADFFGFVDEIVSDHAGSVGTEESGEILTDWRWFELPTLDEHGCPVLKIEPGGDQP